MKWGKLFYYNGLVLRYESLHDDPTYKVGYGADAEDNHVAGRLSFETEEGEGTALLFCIGEEGTGTLVDEEGAHTTCHTADTDDGSDGRLGEHVTDGREDVGRPGLVGSTQDTNQDDGEPGGAEHTAERLCEETQQGEEGEDEHGAHTAFVRIIATVDEIGGSLPPRMLSMVMR